MAELDEVLYGGHEYQFVSSHVDSIAYAHDQRILTVNFSDGSTYEYFNVPVELVEEFVGTSSPGSFVWYQLRGLYSYRKV